MHVIIDNDIEIQDPSKEIISWVKSNLVFANPDYSKKSRMGLWLGNVPKLITLYRIDSDSIRIPYGCFKEIIPFIEKDDTTYELKFDDNPPKINYNSSIPLRDYQKVAVNEMIKCSYGILQSKAGSGKTQMGIAILTKLNLKTLWITHTKDLLNQTKSRATQYMDASLIGTITEGKVCVGKGLTIATVQTLSNINLLLYKNTWQCIIVDECHRCAGSATSVTQFSKVLETLSAKHKYGLSATVHRSDGLIRTTYALLGKVVHIVPDEAIGGYVMNVEVEPIMTGIKVSDDCLSSDGMIDYTKVISYICNSYERNQLIISKLTKVFFDSTLVLSDRISHLEQLMSMLPPRFRKEAVLIDGKMTSKTQKALREKAIEDMRLGKKKFLFATYNLAKEGLDIPRLNRLFLVTPKRDSAVITQCVGRIARQMEGKSTPICFDYVDSIGILIKSYKDRLAVYKKINCKIRRNENAS